MNNIKNFAKKTYKFTVSFIFKIIYGKVNLNKPNYLKVENSNIPKSNKKEKYKIYTIKNGRICTDGVEQVAYISKNNIIKNISYTQIHGKLVSAKKNFVIKRGTPYFKRNYSGSVLSLAQGASGDKNYFHWMFDILPKIRIVLSKYKIDEIDYLYMPKLQKFQKQILKLYGLKNINVIDSKRNKHIQADKIIVPEHPWYTKNSIFHEVNYLPTWISKWLRKIFFKKKIKSKKIKIFVDRSETANKHCQLINNDEIKKYLSKKGFKSIMVGKLGFLEQVKLFNNAKIIIGAHGAAFTNLIFCRKNTKVIEIKPIDRPDNYVVISKTHNLQYKQIITPLIQQKNNNGDIFLDIKKLSKFI